MTEITGPGWLLNQFTNLYLVYTFLNQARNMLVVQQFLESLVSKYGKHTIYSDGGTWYPEACKVLRLKHNLHSPLERSLIERVIQYFKDRTEGFDDYYPCVKKDCNLEHVYNWIELLFVSMYNNTVVIEKKSNPIITNKEVIIS